MGERWKRRGFSFGLFEASVDHLGKDMQITVENIDPRKTIRTKDKHL